MRFPLTVLMIVASLFLSTAKAEDSTPEMSIPPVQGEEIIFDVYLSRDTPLGAHIVRFEQDGQDLVASVDIDLRVRLGPITVFRYEHDSTERWRDDALFGFTGRTLKDGSVFTVQAASSPIGIDVEGTNRESLAFQSVYPAAILPSSHWRGYRVGEDTVLNTEYGTLMDIRVTYLGEEQIEADGGVITASRYRLTGSLTVDLWYDENGRWAGCAFETRNQTIRYVRRANPIRS